MLVSRLKKRNVHSSLGTAMVENNELLSYLDLYDWWANFLDK